MNKNKEIIANNILIAEFMGGKPANQVKDNPIAYIFPFEFGHQETWDEGGFQGSGKSFCWDIEDLQYHSDWNWLMPVVDKVRDCNCMVSIRFNRKLNTNCTMIAGFDTKWKKDIEVSEEGIKSTYEAVIQFINWFNNNKQ